jgi:Protein of unknown function (DUF2971)
LLCATSMTQATRLPGAKKIIYHYTDQYAILPIIQTGVIRLTDYYSFNDPSELRHGIQPALTLFHQAALQGAAFVEFHDRFRFTLEQKLPKVAHFFACCLSFAGNSLGQWRGYADNGHGYAIGFNTTLLEDSLSGADPLHNMSFPILYDDNRLNAVQTQIVNLALPLIQIPERDNFSAAATNRFFRELSVRVALEILAVAILFKHEAYIDEAELRLLRTHRGDVPVPNARFRTGRHGVVTYLEFNWASVAASALEEIVIGPAVADRDREVRYVVALLQSAGYGHVRVQPSIIPYRP